MGEIIIPQGYKSALNLHDTQVAIKTVKDYFQHELTHRLHLLRVTAPLFVQPETGLNDNLNGVEHPVSFELKDQGTKKTAEIVQSLAKWKRYALHKYGFSEGEGIYTDTFPYCTVAQRRNCRKAEAAHLGADICGCWLGTVCKAIFVGELCEPWHGG